MAKLMTKVRYILYLYIFFLVSSINTEKRPIFNPYESEDDKYSIWNILENLSPPISRIPTNVRSNSLLDDISQLSNGDVLERDLEVPGEASAVHRRCKIIRKTLPNQDDGYVYFPKYENICVEASNDDTDISVSDSDQYCYIIHNPGRLKPCETKTRQVKLFRTKHKPEDWKFYRGITIGVGCECWFPIIYANELV